MVRVLGKNIDKRFIWAALIAAIAILMLTSAAATRLLLFTALLIFNSVFTYFHVRLRVPVDITPLTISLLVSGYFFGPISVIVLFLFGSFLPGVLAGSGLGPSSFVYIPLNIGLGIIFPLFAAHSFIFTLIVFVGVYSFLVFLIDGFFFSSYARSLATAATFAVASLPYIAVIWRVQTIFRLA